MISTDSKRVQLQDIVEHQLPAYVRDDFPLIVDFLKQYYIGQEYPGAPVDLIQNIDLYLKLETLTSNAESTELSSNVSLGDTTISVSYDVNSGILGTTDFPEKYGLIQINDEVILYTDKTRNTFTGCIRGFSGITDYSSLTATDKLTFSNTNGAAHTQGTKVINLSALLFAEFLKKIKTQFTPGFDERELSGDVNERLFVSRAKDFYQSKGTDESFKILFHALYGEDVEVLKPQDFLFKPSDAQYRVTKDIVVEAISGDPLNIKNQTLFQDEFDDYNISKAYASITDVEKLLRDGREFYKLSVDFDYSKDITFDGSVLGEFSVHPFSKIITKVSAGSSIIDVDSTIGFPKSGELVVKYTDGTTGIMTYRDKSINQFFSVGVANTTTIGLTKEIDSTESVRLNTVAYSYVGVGTANKVTMRIGSVLAEPVIEGSTYYFSKNDTGGIKSLGITARGAKAESFLYNVATELQVEKIEISDKSVPSYTVKTYSAHRFKVGDSISLVSSEGSSDGTVTSIVDETSFITAGQGTLTGSAYTVRRNLLKGDIDTTLSDYYYAENIFTDVQNTYAKFNQDLLVASTSVPRYYDTPLDFYDRKVKLDGSYSGEIFTVSVNDHGYQTGDSVYYEKYKFTADFGYTVESGFDIEEGVYYVKRVNDTQFKLSTSQANLYNDSFVSVSGIVTANSLTDSRFQGKSLENQKLLREVIAPTNESNSVSTEAGKTGILINGVEILNYKSNNAVYYGTIDDITVTSKGSGYDIINPPHVNISDSVGTGATATAAVIGSLNRIEILDSGFDYVETPVVTISGGNGLGAKAYANTKIIDYAVSFNSEDNAKVSTSDNSIGFSTFHKFRNGERVTYRTDGQKAVGGISTDAQYYVQTTDASTIKLYKDEGDALVGLNTVSLSSLGIGVQRLETVAKKTIVSNIIVEDSGSGYQSKARTTSTAGINTALNQINITNHGYKSEELVRISSSGTVVGGLNESTSYYVTIVDGDNFKLSSVGLGTTAANFYYNTKQYIDLTSTGSGTHTFNYEPIVVTVSGKIGVTTFSGQDFNALIQPVFRGEIDSIQVNDGGVGYGASTIIGYNRQPIFTISSGSGAELLPIVNNGRIQEVIVTNSGSGYNSTPNIEVFGTGKYCVLVPVVTNGRITDVKVANAGAGYENKTRAVVIASGSNARLEAEIQKWTVNLFEKYYNILSDDDGILTSSMNEEYGIQYSHLYAPRKLRQSVFSKIQGNDIKYGVFDLTVQNGEEIASKFHSPIIGWAYDGNPIYGPYGFSTNSGGVVTAMKSGYEKIQRANHPDSFDLGFFVEDYQFTNAGDLDEHNGRFCITPEYPNGVYAYFATINPTNTEGVGAFQGFRKPQFPYLIGNSYKSKPNPFNFALTSNQRDYDLNSSDWFRNTTPYSLTETTVNYNFLYEPNKVRNQTVNIVSVSTGSIDNIGIVTGGKSYQVGDKITFEGKSPAKARVSKVSGISVDTITSSSTTVSPLEIIPSGGAGVYVAFAATPHNLTNKNLVSLAGFNTSIGILQGSFIAGVSSDKYSLSSAVGNATATGIVTYFSIGGNLSSIYENDIFELGSEKVKVLNVEIDNSRVRVLRSVEGTVSAAHTATSVLSEVPRRFSIQSSPELDIAFELNKELYFNPGEALGVGTIAGVGIGNTVFFSNPGAGITQKYVQTRNIYLPKHEFKTGDEVKYAANGGLSIQVATDPTGVTTFRFGEDTPVFIAKISDDLIGIATVKVGLGSTGTFTGVANTTASTELLYFTGIGTGVQHSFTTVKTNVVTCEATRNVVTVSTASTHALEIADTIDVNVDVGTTQTITVKYDDFNRRIVFNPKTFIAGNVDTTENTVTISDHGYRNGDKVIHTATTPSGGLVDERIYYVRRFTKDKVKFCTSRHEALKFNPVFVDITSTSAGTLSAINPRVDAYEGSTVKFDLSDSSLSSLNGATLYSAFDFDIYNDKTLSNVFDSTGTSGKFEVTKIGNIGIDANAALNLIINKFVPTELYYKFTPANISFTTPFKQEIVIDTETYDNNKIEVVPSKYTGSHTVTGIAATSFTYNVSETPESASYTNTNSTTTYKTNSTTAYGAIEDIQITYKGAGYENVIGISEIVGVSTNTNRKDAILEPKSTTIGSILDTEIKDIGFNYPSDNTLRPVLQLPEILEINPLSSFDSIGITSAGQNYSSPPGLVVLDGLTGKTVNDVDLEYDLGDTSVRILKNTSGMYNTNPTILPVGNSNGIKIKTISFDMSTREVTVGLNTSYSESAPFSVGDKVLIENVSVGVGTTGNGYNSEAYGYALFTLDEVYIPLGGSVGVVTYSLANYLEEGIFPGNFDTNNSAGRIVNEKNFPQFDVKLKKNNFIIGETVTSDGATGIVESWNNQIELLKVSTKDDFLVNDTVVGETSRTKGTVRYKTEFDAQVKIDSGSVVKKGWGRNTGVLNTNTERLPDNDYYQNFSYSLKSQVPFDKWEDAVSSLSHTAGFLKFSDLVIESEDRIFQGVYSDNDGANVTVVVDLDGAIDLDCYPYFDLVTENSLLGASSGNLSDEIFFNSRVLTDYFESFGNRVLTIDDISPQFNNTPRPTRFSVVKNFDVNQKVKKIFFHIADKLFTDEKQASFVTILHDGSQAVIGQYGRVETTSDLGTFDFRIRGSEAQVLFFPTKFAINNYNVTHVSFDIDSTVAGVGETMIGNIVDFKATKTLGISSASTIVSFGTTYRSAKVIIEINDDFGNYEYDELNILHDGTNVEAVTFGQLSTQTLNEFEVAGLGTYSAEIDSGNVIVKLHPKAGIACTTHAFIKSITNSSVAGIAGTVNIGTLDGSNISRIDSKATSIASTSTPTANTVSSFALEGLGSAYYLVSVEDKTNSKYAMSELIGVIDESESYATEYGSLETGGIGTFGFGRDSDNALLQFTPEPNIEVDVRVLQVQLDILDVLTGDSAELDLQTASVTAGFGFYEGTEIDVKRAFAMRHKGREIFQRNFDASDSNVINVSDNTIFIPEHFFVTGEELVYSYADTSTPPTGLTTTTVFAVKVDDRKIKIATTAANALATIPTVIGISSVGVGTFHTFTSKNQNTKCMIALDNMIQQPIVSTAVTTGLSTSLRRSGDVINLTGISSIFGGDLIKINDEIMKVNTVGHGGVTSAVLVDRAWMGTGIGTHAQFDKVTKINGAYNIVDNTLHFYTSPTGPTPIGSTTNEPDSRDFTGITTSSFFQGRTFIRSAAEGTAKEVYNTNYVFDDISSNFDAKTKTFTLTSSGQNVTGFSTNNAVVLVNNIFQGPTGLLPVAQDYSLNEGSGISSITFTGTATSISSDPNSATVPVGGLIVSVGSTGGFGYQPLVSAGATAIVSSGGTVSSISIGNSGSGYRTSQTVFVGVTTANIGTPNITRIGIATVSGGHIVGVAITNGGSGFFQGSEPIVIIDAPNSYSNIPLEYSSDSSSGLGTEATVDIVVGQGSSVIDFEIRNLGYNYRENHILTVPVGGATGIPTDTTSTFEEFQITVQRTESDSFSAWHFGELDVLDKIENEFDGIKRTFTLKKNDSPITIRAAEGSVIDVESTLLIFVNDILQVPGEGYSFPGGSALTFAEPPRGASADGNFSGDKVKILFYKGSGDVDVIFRDVLETVKIGDDLTIENQEERLVDEIVSSDTVGNNPYSGPGIDDNPNNIRTVTWCKQRNDKIINGQIVSKARVLNSALINPTTHVIQSVGVGSTNVYVESVSTFFNPTNENNTVLNTQKIELISQDIIVGASATAIVSAAGTISSIVVSTGGTGYVSAPDVIVANPVGLGTTTRASATTTLTGDTVSSVTVTSPGTGYTVTNPPVILIETPTAISEENTSDSYTGDFGLIVGVTTTSVGLASTAFVLDLFIPTDSYLRDTSIVSAATTISTLKSGDYFVVKSSNVGSGVTSLYQDNTVLGVTTQFLDSVYEVATVSTATTAVAGVGVTYVRRVTVSVSDLGNISGIGLTEFYGEYSWGLVDLGIRKSAQAFSAYTLNGSAGISTSAKLTRVQPLKLSNYS
jgi:hypothetical protein